VPTSTAPPLPSPIVVVDSNTIVRGAWRLDSPAWKVLLHQAASGHIRLLVPELVLREAVGRFVDEVERRHSAADREARKLNELTGQERATTPATSLADVATGYKTTLREKLSEFGVEMVDLPEIRLGDLVQRAITRTKPFDERGSGFRDAILWETVVALMRANPDSSAVLISNDRKAFADAGDTCQLHPNLRRELGQRGVSKSLELAETVDSYLGAAGIDDAALVAQMIEDVEAQQEQLVELALAVLERGELESPWQAVRFTVLNVQELQVSLERAGGSSEEEGLSLVHLGLDARTRVEIRFDDDAPPTVNELIVPIRGIGAATYNRHKRQFADLRVELPAATELPTLMAELRALDPRRVVPVAFTPEALERLRQAWHITPEAVERLQLASQMTPEAVERLGLALQVAPQVVERLRQAVRVAPELVERLRQAWHITPEAVERLRQAWHITPEAVERLRRMSEGSSPSPSPKPEQEAPLDGSGEE
jgi:predicted nucleic acid-binding protein